MNLLLLCFIFVFSLSLAVWLLFCMKSMLHIFVTLLLSMTTHLSGGNKKNTWNTSHWRVLRKGEMCVWLISGSFIFCLIKISLNANEYVPFAWNCLCIREFRQQVTNKMLWLNELIFWHFHRLDYTIRWVTMQCTIQF